MNVAPIVLFVYNRPWHTEQTLEALSRIELADESILYIYADGPKENADEETLKKIVETRNVIKKLFGFKQVIIVQSQTNLGLANSIIKGVGEVVHKHGAVIVLEDDIVPSAGFLIYMNEALNLYLDDSRVGCIHAWNYNLDAIDYSETTFFLRGADCWGWATWKRSWSLFNPNGAFLLDSILARNLQSDFDRRDTHDYVEMLRAQIRGKNDSWAIRWHASLFLAGKYCLQPTKAIVKNIGFDNSGIHCGTSGVVQQPVDFIKLNNIEVRELEWFFNAYTAYLNKTSQMDSTNKWEKAKNYLKYFFRR